MSDVTNEIGRAVEDSAPVDVLSNADRSFDFRDSAPTLCPDKPSLPEPSALDAHAAAGHQLIPLDGKVPTERAWTKAKPLDLAKAKARIQAAKNVGVRLRPTDLVVDVDPRNFDDGDDPSARLKADFALPEAPFVRTGGGGWHYYFRKPAEVAVVNMLAGYKGIEFKSLGRQVVAAGSIHPDTGEPYRLDDDPLALTLSEAPDVTAALLDAIRKPTGELAGGEPGEITPEQLQMLLSGLDIMAFNRRHDDWLQIMMACHQGTAGLGCDEFVAWSTSDPDYADDEHQIGARWRSLKDKPNGVTIRTLFKALRDAGNGDLIEEVLRSPAPEDFRDEPTVPETASDLALDGINQNHFTVLHGGRYLVGRERKHPTLGHLEVEWFPDHAIRNHLNSRSVEVEDGVRRPLGSWWINHPRRRQYEGVVFDPSPVRRHDELYNLWRGWAIEPRPGDWSLMKRLVKEVLCAGDETAFDYVLRWAAFMVQQPHVPAEVALVFKGPKGVGKGTFGRALKQIAGFHGKQVAQPEHFVGRFNEHLMDCILLFVDEGYWAGDKKAEGALKNLITEPVLSFEPKGKPIVSGPNMLHVIIASNEDWVVPATTDERRFAVFEADARARERLPAGFFDALQRETANGGLNAMLHDLMALDLRGWHPRSNIPDTRALLDQKVLAFKRDPLAFWWFRTLEGGLGSRAIHEPEWKMRAIDIYGPGKEELVEMVGDIAKSMGRYGQFTKTAVARFLRTVGVEVDAKDKRGARVWRVPRLAEARLAFETYVGGSIEWDDA